MLFHSRTSEWQKGILVHKLTLTYLFCYILLYVSSVVCLMLLSDVLAVLSYLNITLPCQSLSPDAEMGREALLNKVQSLADKLDGPPCKPEETSKDDSIVDQEIYDDVVGTGNYNIGSLCKALLFGV